MFIQESVFKLFLLLTIFATIYLIYNIYEEKQFENSPLSNEITSKVYKRVDEVENRAKEIYGVSIKFPISIKNMDSSLYGVTMRNANGIEIVLNRKRFKENLNYMIDDVIPHEYAHALQFAFGTFNRNDGHSREWEKICLELGGSRCDRYVNYKDVIYEKIGF